MIDEIFETLPPAIQTNLIDAFDDEVEYMYTFEDNRFIGVYVSEHPGIEIQETANNWSVGYDNRIRSS